MKNEELEDEKIKNYFSKDKVIPEETNAIFANFENQINFEEKEIKVKKPFWLKFQKFIAAAASLTVVLVGSNAYARTKGYDNIFFMIQEVFEEKQVTNKEDIFSDREITISYQSFNITDKIEMQINKLQIKGDQAKLYIHVYEKEEEKITPFIYRVYNENGAITFNGKSNKHSNETEYEEILNLKKYQENQKMLTLKIYSAQEELLKTVLIKLDEKTIEARTENVNVKKISQVKLNEFLTVETEKELAKNSQNIVNNKLNYEDRKVLVLFLTDISYNNYNYMVRYLYNVVTKEDIHNSNVENLEIEEATAKFSIIGENFNLIEIDLKKN